MQIRHVGIVVEDICKSIEFYAKLGFRGTFNCEKWGEVSILTAKLLNEYDDVIELIQGGWQSHIAITVDDGDIDELITRNLNAEVYNSKDTPQIMVRFIKDPDGNWIELVQCTD